MTKPFLLVLFSLTTIFEICSSQESLNTLTAATISVSSTNNLTNLTSNADNILNPCRDAAGILWLIIPNGGVWYAAPWKIFKGTSLDDMVLQRTVDPSTNGMFPRPWGDDTYWITGFWIDPVNNKWYALTHCEFNYNKLPTGGDLTHMRRIGLATSVDEGATWSMQGDVITSDNSYNPADWKDQLMWDTGCGNASLYVDENYFYCYFEDAWQSSDKKYPDRYSALRVARCARSDKMAPGEWHKFYNKNWNQPGLGGRCSDIMDQSSGGQVFLSSFLNKYCLMSSGFATCTDLNLQDWTKAVKYDVPNRLESWAYQWAADKKTGSPWLIDGNSFRLYCSTNSTPYWKEASLVTTSGNPALVTPNYPPVSVNDGNPGWDIVHKPKPGGLK
jgi:hypothetical protein